jgi:cytoskeletal protein CcmA (bactofilin family)
MFKTKAIEKAHNTAVIAQPERSAVDQQVEILVATPVSCIGSAMTIVGNVECSGPAQVFGRIEGELRATDLMIGEGAQIEGSIQAHDVTISGRVKGTIRAVRVRLQGATVEGDIIHRTLSVGENSVFEGMSRRVENPVDRRIENSAESSSNAINSAALKEVVPSPSVVASASPATNDTLHN